MSKQIQAIRGMPDVLPEDAGVWQHLMATATEVLNAYGYQQVQLPIVERMELFKRSIGEVTDIVEKEMYVFPDRDGKPMALRPEGTAGCVRAGIQHGLLRTPGQRLWYAGPMFRYERPQLGRSRQFNQIGVETFGLAGPDIDVEILALIQRLFGRLGLDGLRLELNSLGSSDARAAYRARLVEYFEVHRDQLDEDSQRRLTTNPLRILDSKNPDLQELIESAPQLIDHIDDEDREHFEGVKAGLEALDIAYVVNPRLVRGLDYYCRTVFEWTTTELGAQGTVCAGGRYDPLVAQLGGADTPAAGCAFGLERMVALMQQRQVRLPESTPHAYLVHAGEQAEQRMPVLAEELRSRVPGLRVVLNCGGGSFKSQFKRADRCQAAVALVLGDDECARGEINLKDMRGGEQYAVALKDVAGHLAERFNLQLDEQAA